MGVSQRLFCFDSLSPNHSILVHTAGGSGTEIARAGNEADSAASVQSMRECQDFHMFGEYGVNQNCQEI
jgi:hypothetical protein